MNAALRTPMPGRSTWTSPSGLVSAVIDTIAFDFHYDVADGDSHGEVDQLLAYAHDLGFEPMDEEECPAEVLDNGALRIYMVPMIPADYEVIGVDVQVHA